VRTHWKRGWLEDSTVVREAPTIKWQEAFNREKFCKNFGYADATDFTYPLIEAYTEKYKTFKKELQDAHRST
jgi:hypothetical protein